MTHRAESIMSAAESVLTGLATTGANVERGRVWPVSGLPALTIAKGADAQFSDGEDFDGISRILEFSVSIHVTPTGNPETAAHAILAEVYAALRADITLGLAYAYECEILGDDEIELDDSTDTKKARLVSNWRVYYDHSLESAEV